VDATTHLVAEGHDSVARTTVEIASAAGLRTQVEAVDSVRATATDAVLGGIRGVNRFVETVSDIALAAVPLPDDPEPARPLNEDALFSAAGAVDQLTGVLNGFVGDTLRSRDNGLDLGMMLRDAEGAIQRPVQAKRVVLFVHGLSTTETSWCFGAAEALGDPAATFGTLLQHDLDYTPLFARYNTGLPVADNGSALAALIDAYLGDVGEIVLVGHSMGGLVSRAATTHGTFVRRLTHLICLASPHRGAPLARLGETATRVMNAVDHPATQVIGTMLAQRSVGIRDLERVDAPDLGPLLDTVDYLFIAGTALADPDTAVARRVGDLLVNVRSAEGPDGDRVTRRRLGSALHHAVQVDPRVYDLILDFLRPAQP
jgi:pimeloyl-ACP methyl ester carboxylesterase